MSIILLGGHTVSRIKNLSFLNFTLSDDNKKRNNDYPIVAF